MLIRNTGESEDTLAFYKAYESGIRDEDHPELLFLQQHQETQDVLMLDASRVSEDEEDGENHFISTKELLAKIREPEQDQVGEFLGCCILTLIETRMNRTSIRMIYHGSMQMGPTKSMFS